MRSIAIAAVALLALAGCPQKSDQAAPAPAPPAPEGPRIGALMTEIGHRFEMLGRAATAHRWELAAWELGELDEALAEVPKAVIPKDVNAETMRSFPQMLPIGQLRSALEAKSDVALAAAFSQAAAVCNSCHQANARGFIEVPQEPGAAVPRLDPKP